MTRKHLYFYLLREERSLRANAAAWRLLLASLPEEAVRPLAEALDTAWQRAYECRRALYALLLSDREEN